MDPLALFAIVALGLAGVALVNGIIAMTHGGGVASNQAMRWRVVWQAAALAAVLLALLGA